MTLLEEKTEKTRVVDYVPDLHEKEFEEFVSRAYHEDHILLDKAFLKWQFRDNPANPTEGFTIKIVLKGESVVAMCAAIPVTLNAGGRVFRACYPVNLMTLPEFRALGLGFVLLRGLSKEFDVVINPGSSQEGEKLCQALKFKSLGMLKRWLLVIDVAQAADLYSGPPAHFESLQNKIQMPNPSAVHTCLDEVMWKGALPPSLQGVPRSYAFLKWRYMDHPHFKYDFLVSKDQTAGIVYRLEKVLDQPQRICRIVEMLGEEQKCELLLQNLMAILQTENVALADFVCSTNLYDRIFQEAGFITEGDERLSGFPYLFQPLSHKKVGIRCLISDHEQLAYDLNSWYVTKGDSDQDRPNSRR